MRCNSQTREHELVSQNLGAHIRDAMQLGRLCDFSWNSDALLHGVLEDIVYLLLARVLLHCVQHIGQAVDLIEPHRVTAAGRYTNAGGELACTYTGPARKVPNAMNTAALSQSKPFFAPSASSLSFSNDCAMRSPAAYLMHGGV